MSQQLAAGSLALVIAVLATTGTATAQIPDEFTNLKLFDPDISKPELVGTMRDWATGLGVRCSHCHVGPDDLQGMDFASDEKDTKRTARRMLEMSRTINRELMTDLPVIGAGEKAQVVSCFTCHRGQSKPPRNITSVLGRAIAEEGVDAALAEYDELRTEHYGAGVYDFSESALGRVAGDLAQSGQVGDAIRILRRSLDYHPESADVHAMLGMVYLQSGDAEAARPALERALELDPDNRMATRAMEMLEPAPEVPTP